MQILTNFQSDNGIVISAIVQFQAIISPIPSIWKINDNKTFNNAVFNNDIDETKYDVSYCSEQNDYYVYMDANNTIININPQYRKGDSYTRTFNEIFDQVYKLFGYSCRFSNPKNVMYKITNSTVNEILDKQYNNMYGRMVLTEIKTNKLIAHVYPKKNGGHAVESIDSRLIREAYTFDKLISEITMGNVIIV